MDESQRWVEFGRWLAEQREAAGLKRREAAKKAKVSEVTWRDLETGRKDSIGGIRLLPNPSSEVLERIAGAVGVPMEELMKHVGRLPVVSRPARANQSTRSVLAVKVSRLSARDRQIVELLVDAMIEAGDAAEGGKLS
ncbi:MAG: helix-turn-helix domain-containing protein [Acidimicrobiales bacterium]